jgi:hypothetical protein
LVLIAPITGFVLYNPESVVGRLAPVIAVPTGGLQITQTGGNLPAQPSADTPASPEAPIATPVPIAIEIMCPDAPSIRVQAGDRARVITSSTLRIRSSPKVINGTNTNVLLAVPSGTIVEILDGPVCEGGYAWWRVSLSDSTIGWVAEGDLNRYFIESIN